MKYEIIVVTKNTQKASWGYLRNRYYIDSPITLTLLNCKEKLTPLLSLYQKLLKTSMEIICIGYRGLESEGETPPSGLHVFTLSDSRGQNIITGQMLYRYVLQLNLETQIGRHHKNWIRGALDTGDLILGENNQISMEERSKFNTALDSFMAPDTTAFFSQMIPRPLYISPNGNTGNQQYTKMYTYGACNGNAQTRIRFGVESQGVSAYLVIVESLVLMTNSFNYVTGRFISDGAFTFADVYETVLAALGAPKVVYGNIKDYFEDANQKAEDGNEAPLTRFGATCATIGEAFNRQAEEVEEQVPEMQKLYKPYTDAFDGFDYVRKVDMEPYLDLLQSVIEATAFSLSFDAYNPSAFEGQTARSGADATPEFVKMQL